MPSLRPSKTSSDGLRTHFVDLNAYPGNLIDHRGGFIMAIHRLQMYRNRTRQKRTALHMLILSGVVRPSHIGLRYTTLLTQAEEQTSDSLNSPSQASNHLRRLIRLLQRAITQLKSLEPQFMKPCTFKLRRATTSSLCSLTESECDSSLVPLP